MSQSGEARPVGLPRVYVDDAFVSGDWGIWTGGGHLQADTPEALHAFAARLGLRREWFQSRPGRPDRDHYDLTQTKRVQAIEMGAIPETVRDGIARRRGVGPVGQRAGAGSAPGDR